MKKWSWILAGVACLGLVGLAGLDVQAKDNGAPKAKGAAKPTVTLPQAASDAVKALYANGTLGHVTKRQGKTEAYNVAVTQVGSPDVKVGVTADGTIIEIASATTVDDLAKTDKTKPVADAINAAATGATITRVDKIEQRAKLTKTGYVKQDPAKVAYTARLTKDTQKGTMTVDDSGKVVKPLKWAEPKAKKTGTPAPAPAPTK